MFQIQTERVFYRLVLLSSLLGQHLITALADSMFGYKTTSWYFSTSATLLLTSSVAHLILNVCRELGRQRCSIELDTPSVKPDELRVLEEATNDKIRAHIPVSVQLLSIDDPQVEKVRS